MNTVLNARSPRWFWIVAILLLVWNAIGVFMYISSVSVTDAQLAAMPAERQELLAAMPVWAIGAFAIAVFAGLLASIALLMRKSWARIMFILSLIAIVINDGWAISAGALAQLTVAEIAIDFAIVLIAVFSIWLANRGNAHGWLR